MLEKEWDLEILRTTHMRTKATPKRWRESGGKLKPLIPSEKGDQEQLGNRVHGDIPAQRSDPHMY